MPRSAELLQALRALRRCKVHSSWALSVQQTYTAVHAYAKISECKQHAQ